MTSHLVASLLLGVLSPRGYLSFHIYSILALYSSFKIASLYEIVSEIQIIASMASGSGRKQAGSYCLYGSFSDVTIIPQNVCNIRLSWFLSMVTLCFKGGRYVSAPNKNWSVLMKKEIMLARLLIVYTTTDIIFSNTLFS